MISKIMWKYDALVVPNTSNKFIPGTIACVAMKIQATPERTANLAAILKC